MSIGKAISQPLSGEGNMPDDPSNIARRCVGRQKTSMRSGSHSDGEPERNSRYDNGNDASVSPGCEEV